MNHTLHQLVVLPLVALLLLPACTSPRHSSGGDHSETLRILAYNIHHGEGMDDILDLERIARLIVDANPDVVALQEIDSVVTRTNGVDQARVLGELTGMSHVFGRFMEYQGGAYGMAVLSKWPIDEVHNYRLPDGDEPRSSVTVTITSPATGARVRLSDIHFYRTEDERLAQATSLLGHLADSDTPTILAGDFNSEPNTKVMNYLSGNDWVIVNKDNQSRTFPSYNPEREIDFMLLKPASRFRVISHATLDEPVASDHSPILLELALIRASNGE